jgi:16S rRNA A1518/A1519 N6-dimethyltransferase RsmA/KsgA/DIM1 with predicted DNA glycosylase/AP lyase activity
MKHSDLKPGDIVLTRRIIGRGLGEAEVVKVTKKTVTTRLIHNSFTSRHSFYIGPSIFLPNPEVLAKIVEMDAKISELSKERSLLFKSLDRVTFEEVD